MMPRGLSMRALHRDTVRTPTAEFPAPTVGGSRALVVEDVGSSGGSPRAPAHDRRTRSGRDFTSGDSRGPGMPVRLRGSNAGSIESCRFPTRLSEMQLDRSLSSATAGDRLSTRLRLCPSVAVLTRGPHRDVSGRVSASARGRGPLPAGRCGLNWRCRLSTL